MLCRVSRLQIPTLFKEGCCKLFIFGKLELERNKLWVVHELGCACFLSLGRPQTEKIVRAYFTQASLSRIIHAPLETILKRGPEKPQKQDHTGLLMLSLEGRLGMKLDRACEAHLTTVYYQCVSWPACPLWWCWYGTKQLEYEDIGHFICLSSSEIPSLV